MKRLKFLFSNSLIGYLWGEIRLRYYFKFTLPKLTEIQLENIRLDVRELSPKARNRLLHAGYETHEKNMCRDFLSPDDSVLEIGAAIGFIGLYCQKNIGIRRYVLVEPNPRTFAMLKRNYTLNGLTPVALNLALSCRDGTVELNIDSDFWEHSIVSQMDPVSGRKTMDVTAVSFQTLLRAVRNPFNVLIVDIEGAEQFIDCNQIPKEVNKIIIEIHPHLLGPEKTYEIVASLIGNGFRVAREECSTFVFLKAAQEAAIPDAPHCENGDAAELCHEQLTRCYP